MLLTKGMQIYYVLRKDLTFDKTKVAYAYQDCVVTTVNKRTARIKASGASGVYTVSNTIPDSCHEFNIYRDCVLEATETNRLFIEGLLKQCKELEDKKQQDLKQVRDTYKKKQEETVAQFLDVNGSLTGVTAVTDKMRMYSSVIRDPAKNLVCTIQAVAVDKSDKHSKFSDVTIMTHTNRNGGYAVRVVYPEHVSLSEDCQLDDLLLNAIAKVYYEIFVEGRT